MQRSTTFAFSTVLCAALAAPHAVEAQENPGGMTGGSVQEVVMAFLGVEESDIVVGQVPETAAELFLLPPGSRIVGSIVRSDSPSSIVDSELETGPIRDWLTEAYRAAGWTATEDRRRQGGFAPSSSERTSQFCRDGENVFVRLREGDGVSRLVYNHHDSVGNTSCEQMERQYAGDSARSYEFPSLVAPEGVEQFPSMSCSGSQEQAIGTALRTDQPAVEIADHYGLQLDEEGWLPAASCFDGPVAVRMWQIEADSETPLRGLLLVTERGELMEVFLSAAGPTPY